MPGEEVSQDLFTIILSNPIFWIVVLVVVISWVYSKFFKKPDNPYKKPGWGKAFLASTTEKEIKKIISTTGQKTESAGFLWLIALMGIVVMWGWFFISLNLIVFFLAIILSLALVLIAIVLTPKPKKLFWNAIELGDIQFYLNPIMQYEERKRVKKKTGKGTNLEKKKKTANVMVFMVKSRNLLWRLMGFKQRVFVISKKFISTDANSFHVNLLRRVWCQNRQEGPKTPYPISR